MVDGPLTAKQERFALEIVAGANQTDAYRAAYNASGMSDETLWKRACELVRNRKVKGRIDELRAEMAKPFLLTREDYIRRQLAMADKFADSEDHKAVSTASRALERAAKAAQLLSDRVEHSGGQTIRVVRE